MSHFYHSIYFLLLYCLALSTYSQAQQNIDYTQLSYQQIDSLLMLNYQKRDFKTNIKILEAGIKKSSAEFGGRDSLTAEMLNNLGFFHSATGNKEKALQFYIKAKDIRGEILGKQHPAYAMALINIAHIYRGIKDYEKALALFLQAKDILSDNPTVKKTDYAKILFDIASLYIEQKQYQKALPKLQEALDIYKKELGAEHPKTAQVTLSLASAYHQLGRIKEAIELNIMARDISIQKLGKIHTDVARANLNLADIYSDNKDYNRALEISLEAKDIYEQILGKKHPFYLIALNRMTNLHLLQDNTIEAQKTIQEALQIAAQTPISMNITSSWVDSLKKADYLSNAHIQYINNTLLSLYNLLKISQHPKRKGRLVADLAHTLLTKSKNNLSNDKDKLKTLENSNFWLRRSLSVIPPEDIAEAFYLADKNKSNLLLQATQSDKKYRLGNLPDSIIQKDIALIKHKNKLYAKLQEEVDAAQKKILTAQFNEVNLEIDHLHQEIAKKHPKYHALKYKETIIDINKIQKKLPSSTALIEYVISDSTLHVFCITSNNSSWKKVNINANLIRQKAKDLHATLSNYTLLGTKEQLSRRQFSTLAYDLYLKLVAPLEEELTQIEHLIIIPDRELGYIPFEVLLPTVPSQELGDYQNFDYLINRYTFSYNYSAALWLDNAAVSSNKNNNKIFGIAASYQTDSVSTLGRSSSEIALRKKLLPLPEAQKEIATLEKEFKGLFVYNNQASERILKKNVNQYAVLHLALHGILDENKPILSSLALTEDGDSIENNFWQAYEISKMDLNADLVVLSACETGYGRFETGNGIASLARSFMYAGVPSLIVSLWQVNDRATAIIMELFYQNLANGMTKPAALRQAKLAYIQRAEGIAGNPAFWSPFIQIGNQETITLAQKKPFGLFAWLGVGSILTIILGFFVWQYKKRE